MEHFCDQLYSTRLLGIRIKVDVEYDKTMLLCTRTIGTEISSILERNFIGFSATMQGYLFNV